jgi:Flp pilus assembly protein TadG
MIVRRFVASDGGNFGMMMAIATPVFVAAVGLALDISTLSNARSHLQSSLDSAVLAASRLDDASKSRDELFQAFLSTNLVNMDSISNPKGDITIDKGLNFIETKGTLTADVKLTFMRGMGDVGKVTVVSAAYEATNELEVALVLDNTGSMGSANMAALRSAATGLVDILASAKSENRKVTAALVPFVAQVNIKGEGYSEAWIDKDGKAPYHGVNFEMKNASTYYNHLDLFKHLKVDWKGCVEARPAPYNLSDDAPDPANPSTLFVPAFAPDNPGAAAKSPNLSNKWNNSYLADSFASSDKAKVKTIARYFAAATARYIDENGPRSTGPNYACATPIVPLTSDFAKLKTAISKMIYWEGGGTNVSEGLAWGMRVLSPGEPYTQGKAFKADGVSKVVVVFTDGENTVFGASSETFNTSDYGAYGFLDSNRMGTTNRSTALINVNTWTQSMCTSLKNQDVQIFTVLLGADTAANRTLYSTCASTPANYYPTSDVSQLKSVFQKIGTAVAQLSLTH